jgi:penicillin amidase
MRRAATLLAVLAVLACKSEEKAPGIPVVATVGANPSLGAGVEVLYDGWGVPHVYAKSDGDAAYAMGYLQARDRLFQMDLLRRFARGRLAELVGTTQGQAVLDEVLAADRGYRTLFTSTEHTASGSYRIEDVIAERARATSPALVAILEAYAAGVNRYLDDLAAGHDGARLPVEYSLVGAGAGDVAPWTIEDTLAIGRLITWQLSESLEAELAYGELYLALGGSPQGLSVFADLTRFAPATDSTILPAGATALAPSAALAAPGAAQALASARAALSRLPRLSGPEKAGSNNWVLSRDLADGAHALLANDPHLSLSNPSNFHLIHLSTPTRDVAGVSFPGAPVIEIGHNGKIAWGATVVGYDVTDVYVERARVVNGVPEIVTPTGAPAPVVIQETFGVRGGAPVTFPVVLVPNHGPVLPTTLTASSPTAYTMKWTGQFPSDEVLAFWDLNAAGTVAEAFQAIKKFEVGAQNFVIADTAGNIGYFPHAYVPIRGTATNPCTSPPWAPMPGDGSCDWSDRLREPDDASCAAAPLKCLPRSLNPARGWIATANNDITGFTLDNQPLNHPAYLYAFTDLGYRHARIVERLGEKTSGYTLDDMSAIQSDDFSKLAQALVPALLAWWGSSSAVVDKGLKPAADLLAGWDFRTPAGLATADPTSAALPDPGGSSAAAALFHALVPRLARRLLDDDLALYVVDGAPLSVDRFVGMADDQELAKYLAALAIYAQGGRPSVGLVTQDLQQSLCRVQPSSGGSLTETCADMAVLALEDAVEFLSRASVLGSVPADWRWGRLHRVVFESPLSQLGAPLFDYGPFANDGGLYTVDVGNFSWSDDGSSGFASERGFIQGAGPNVRFTAEIGSSGVRWRAVIPGGESGFAGDPHYQDQIPAWLANEKVDQPYTRAEVDAAATGRLLFTR